jgi:hypothetical protein
LSEGQAKQEVDRPRYREFTVTPGLCGFKVKIGCSEAYFGGAADLLNAIEKYMDDPQKTERRFMSNDIRFSGGIGITAAPCDPAATLNRDEVRVIRDAIRPVMENATGTCGQEIPR